MDMIYILIGAQVLKLILFPKIGMARVITSCNEKIFTFTLLTRASRRGNW